MRELCFHPLGASEDSTLSRTKESITTSLALMITTVLCYSATLGSHIADYGTLCRVEMGNVG